jgi:hypothetical protein
MSGFLEPRISAQAETDTTEFEAEFNELRFYNIPSKLDAKTHYSALRELFEYKHGIVIPHKGKIGKYFFKHRREVDVKQRADLFTFIKMTELIEEEKKPKPKEVKLNYDGIIIYLSRDVFPKCEEILCDGYSVEWLNDYITALMNSVHKDKIAESWAKNNQQGKIIGAIFGALKECEVIEGSNRSIGNLIDKKKGATLAKYMGKKEENFIIERTQNYVDKKE